MHRYGNQRGGLRLKVFLWFLLLFAVAHAAITIVPPYMDYARLKDTMTIKAGVSQVLKDEEILRDLAQKARELDLPLKEEHFVLNRDEQRRKMTISTAWDVDVVFFWGAYRHTLRFRPVVEESFMSIMR